MRDLHVYDQDRSWIMGGPLIDGLPVHHACKMIAAWGATLPEDPPTYHERLDVLRHGGTTRPYYTSVRPGEMSRLPSPDPKVEAGPVFAGDARDRHLIGNSTVRGV